MDKFKPKIIKEIADNISCGFDSYYNLKTDEIITIPNFSDLYDENEYNAVFKTDLERIDKLSANFIKIEVLESAESFKIMERFIGQLTNTQFKSELEGILSEKKPFRNFKYLVENSEYRQMWFDFKQNELEKEVKTKLIQLTQSL